MVHKRMRSRNARLSAGVIFLAATAVASLVALPAHAASASTPSPNTPEAVQSGISAAALPGASVFGTTPPGTAETVSFVLREQHLSQLEAAVQRGVTHFLSVRQFASVYGASPANISALTSYLASYGITTTVDPDDVDVVATGTAGEFDNALSVTQLNYDVPPLPGRGGTGAIPAQRVHGTVQPPLLPYRLAHFVLSILGLTNYGPFVSQAVSVDASVLKPQTGSSNDCLASTGLPDACNLPSDFASNYGLDPLYGHGADGSGQSIAIVTVAALDPGGPETFWADDANVPVTGRTVTPDDVDGGPGAPSFRAGSYETDLDVEQAGGVAPGANVIVYQAPNTDYGFADAFFAAASDNIASVVSTSWLESETYLQSSILAGQEAIGYAAAFDEAFLEMADQGQSGFAAAGDAGAYAAQADLGTTNLSVASVADSPYITGAGGTTLPWSGTFSGGGTNATVTVPTQRTWGSDYLWQPIAATSGEPLAEVAESSVSGSGGGFSAFEPPPAYQQRVPGTRDYHALQYLTPTTWQTIVAGFIEPSAWSFDPTPTVTSGFGHGRAVPDIAADADPYTGYQVYSPAFLGPVKLQRGWGGTSFVAPQLAGAAAVIDSYLGQRVGFWNPPAYALATGDRSPFTPLGQVGPGSDNLYYTGNPGQPYNEGSGLGYPNLSALAEDLAGWSPSARS
jgi:kumamolisin